MQITEPSTFISDSLLALATFVFGLRAFRAARRERQVSIHLWTSALWAVALAAAVGGLWHGFAVQLGGAGRAALWKVTVYVIGLMSFLMVSGSTLATVTSPARGWILGLAGVKLLAYFAWMISHDEFRFVLYNYAPDMAAVLVLHALRRGAAATWIAGGIVVSFAGAAAQFCRVSLHGDYFNHNDLYHVIQIGANALLCRGACLLRDAERPGKSAPLPPGNSSTGSGAIPN